MTHKLLLSSICASLMASIVLGTGITCLGGSNTALAAEKINEPVTVTQYQNYLKNYSATDAERAGVSPQYISASVDGAKDRLTQFNDLSFTQRQDVIDHLNNPDFSNLQAESETPFISPFINLASTTTKTASLNYSWKPAKWLPSILAFHDSVTYQVKGKKVVKTTGSDNYVKFNYNPVVSLTKTGNKRHVTNNLAYTWARWKYTLGVNGNGAHIGNCNLSIWGNYKGNVVNQHAFNS